MIVCHCEAVNDQAIKAAVASGAGDVNRVADRCRAGGGCGSCHPALERLLQESQAHAAPISAVA